MDKKLESSAGICVEIYVDCPHCGNFFDLLDDRLDLEVERSDIMIAAFQDEWGCKDAGIEVKCPKCEKEFIVNEIMW
ncbi:hypothetical protein ATE47_04055 [Chryseobacterium sp. IHB B 17019]|uniref:hypothetical protein n=1 Tax=Chryseobacterium sp. IHB B 17019 TaxID=1721091 RepID=UPI00071F145A|nr:hypothetical protein [Chryseobacterium sp. IHB B 17019]ALR29743.1 hypothetical protein ATE47_04055 [Chryseobacterium sp. IHB B 17019]